MPSLSLKAFNTYFKRLMQIDRAANAGADSTTRNVLTGDGANTSISLSDDVLLVQPVNDDSTGTMLVKNNAGNTIFAVDTNNSAVKVGKGQVNSTTHYAHFGIQSVGDAGFGADTHYAIPNGQVSGLGLASVSNLAIGSSTSSSFNDTEPSTTLSISTTAHDVVTLYWYLHDDITLDEVIWWAGADAATGDSTAAHLVSYEVDRTNGSASGNLTGGVVAADGDIVVNGGYEDIFWQTMDLQSANIAQGRVVLFTFASNTANSDYSIRASIKYNIQ